MKAKKKKIAIIIKNKNSASGTFVSQFLKLREIFDIKIYAFEKINFGNNKHDISIQYYAEKSRTNSGFNLNPIPYLSLINEFIWLGRIFMLNHPDIVLSVDVRCNILAALSIKYFLPKSKLVATARNNIIEVSKRKNFAVRLLLRIIGRIILKRVDVFICVSDGVKRSYRKFFKIESRMYVIPDGLNLTDVNKFKNMPIPREHTSLFKGDFKKIISIGRFEEQKDFPTLLKVFSKTQGKIKDLRLILIGDGRQRQMLEEMVLKLKLEKYVHFIGWQKNIYPYLAASDLFILSTKYEGFSYVILEAIATGIPVISTDAPYGPSEILGNGKYGILVPVGSVFKMSEAIISIINNKLEYKKYALKSLKRANFYREDVMLLKYQKLIDSI